VKKLSYIALICTFAAVCALSLSFAGLANMNQPEFYGNIDAHSSDLPYFQQVTKSNGYYNIALAFSNVADPISVDNIIVNPRSEDAQDAVFYLNGTAVNASEPVRFNLKSGDSLQINITLPCTKYAQGSTVELWLTGNSIGYNREITLP
jgi:hypothetical protein